MTLVLTTHDDLSTIQPPTWAGLWLDGIDSRDAARVMGCSNDTAKKRLQQAGRILARRRERCEAAAGLLRHSGVERVRVEIQTPEGQSRRFIGRSRWADIALGSVRELGMAA